MKTNKRVVTGIARGGNHGKSVLAHEKSNLRSKSRGSGKGRILSQKTVVSIERRYQIMCLKRDGYSIKEIADALSCSTQVVHKEIVQSLNTTIAEHSLNTEQERAVEVARLDSLVKAYTPLATKEYNSVVTDRVGNQVVVANPPNPAYATLLLNVASRRAKLLALDVPEVKKLEVTGVREYVGIDMDKV